MQTFPMKHKASLLLMALLAFLLSLPACSPPAPQAKVIRGTPLTSRGDILAPKAQTKRIAKPLDELDKAKASLAAVEASLEAAKKALTSQSGTGEASSLPTKVWAGGLSLGFGPTSTGEAYGEIPRLAQIIQITEPPLNAPGQPSFANEAERESYVQYLNEKLLRVDNGSLVYDPESGQMISYQVDEEAAAGETQPSSPTVSQEQLSKIFQYYGEVSPVDHSRSIFFLQESDKEEVTQIYLIQEPKAVQAIEEVLAKTLAQGAVRKRYQGPFREALLMPSGESFYFNVKDLQDKGKTELLFRLDGQGSFSLPKSSELVKVFQKHLRQAARDPRNSVALEAQPDEGLALRFVTSPGPGKATILASNKGSGTWSYAKSFALSGFADGRWHPIRTPSGTGCYSREITVLEPGDEESFELDWQNCAGLLKRGIYRLQMGTQLDLGQGSAKSAFHQLYFLVP